MKQYSVEEIRKMADMSDWARVDAMRDEDIDLSDIPLPTEEMWVHAVRPNAYALA